MIELECPVCGETFERYPSHICSDEPTCSTECRDQKMRKGEYRDCAECGDEFYATPQQVENGNGTWCSISCRLTGEDNPRWSGGSDGFFDKESGQAWRRAVFERDEYTCQDCGDDSGGNLNAHHIKPRADCSTFEKYAIWNGVTLCTDCHADRHSGEMVEKMIRAGA